MSCCWLCLSVLAKALGALGKAKSPYTWVAQAEDAAFGPLYAHGAVMNFEEQMFIIAGESGSASGSFSNEVWKSSDKGKTWTRQHQRSRRFSARRGHATVVDPQGVIFFVLGGFAGHAQLANDCWSSEDGSVWHSLGNAAWSGRHGHAAVMTSQSWIVLLGGHDGSSYLSDVWTIHHASQPGTSSHLRAVWVPLAKKAPWTARYGHAALVDLEDTIYLLGGFFAEKETGHVQCFNDVWKSTDLGHSWHLVTERADWSGRYQHAATMTSKGAMFVIGGLSIELDRLADVWRSENGGVTWSLVTAAASWAARYEHAALVDQNDTMYVLGGISEGQQAFADVWYSERTCADDIRCKGNLTVCRDGTQKNFEGATNPVCVGICDRRIFDKCEAKEDCKVQHGEPTCVDPCNDKDCAKEQVCEVAPRDEVFRGKMLHSATAYCLSCSDAKTKHSCSRLRQCHWSTGDEACKMRCSVMDEARCKANDACKWSDGDCAETA